MRVVGIPALAGLMLALAVPCAATVKQNEVSAMPKCATADEIVMVNPKTKTYTISHTDAQSRPQASQEEKQQNDQTLQSGLKPMCKSKADAMGAHMVNTEPAPNASPSP